MVAFRRVITALAVLALFTGLAFAQSQENCSTNVTSSTPLRGEGFTEQTGDIVITCTGGVPIAPGGNIPLVNVTVFYNTTVTSRLFATNGTSEALLLIDEPGANLIGAPNSALGQKLCPNPLSGCAAVVSTGVGVNATVPTGQAADTTSGLFASNIYQGVVAGNSVTFFGVPALPPTTVGSRVYRITNVRVNAQPLAGGSASGASPVQASIVISGSASLPISNPAPIVGFVSNGLTATAGGAQGFPQCVGVTRTSVNTLTFSENFGTAFKTRVNASLASQNTSFYGQTPNNVQNVPGAIYNSESNFVFPLSSTTTAGLADFGTRLKATFNAIPTGVRIFVSTANVLNNAVPVTPPAVIGGSAANTATTGYALLVTSETASDGNTGLSFPAAPSDATGAGNVPITEIPIVNGTGTAVWEVVNTNPNFNESFKFAVFTTFAPNIAQNVPLPGSSTVNLSFAPTATSGVASTSLSIPRFAADSLAARTLDTITICRTILLYPFITNQSGFDTGVTVANTTADSFTTGGNATGAQAGSCKFNYFGGTTAAPTTPPATTDTGNIAAGTVYANTLQAIAPGFQGYMFAVCNFQYAHGFAFISDVGARNLAMGYLAVVLNDPGTGSRANVNTTQSENGGH